MSVATLRPNADQNNTGCTLNGGATLWEILSDDSDSSYISNVAGIGPDECTVEMEDFSLPAGALVKALTTRARVDTSGAAGRTWVNALEPNTFEPVLGHIGLVTWSTPTTVQWDTLSPSPANLWDALDYNVLRMVIRGTTSGSQPTDPLRFYALYLDVTYVAKPTLTVDSPADLSTVSTTNLPLIQWTPTLDSDGGAQTEYQVKVFNAAQYGAGGFDPATSVAYDDSGVLAGADVSWQTTEIQDVDSYRAYVRVKQTVLGRDHWSDWTYSSYDVALAVPGVPTLTLTADDAHARVQVDVTGNAGPATTDQLELQVSRDGGASWAALRLDTDTDGIVSGTTATAYDYEGSNGTDVSYRARAQHNYSGELASSAWATGTAQWASTDWWLKCPNLPSLNMVVLIGSLPSIQRPARQGVFQPLGRSANIVVSDKRGAERGQLGLATEVYADQDVLDALLDSGEVLLLQPPPGVYWRDRYVKFGDHERARFVDKLGVELVIESLEWFEVASPAGPVDGWPA